VELGRVAVGDEIGHVLGANLALLPIGERPRLSSPDSLGAYLTWHPAPGRTNAERSCISNIRPDGLGNREAAERISKRIAPCSWGNARGPRSVWPDEPVSRWPCAVVKGGGAAILSIVAASVRGCVKRGR
jgi:hypothetical protein